MLIEVLAQSRKHSFELSVVFHSKMEKEHVMPSKRQSKSAEVMVTIIGTLRVEKALLLYTFKDNITNMYIKLHYFLMHTTNNAIEN